MLQEQFPLPSLSLFHKISIGMIDAVKCIQSPRNEDKIFNDVCLMIDKINFQIYEEYFASHLVERKSEGELYKLLVCFMTACLKNLIPCVIMSFLETKMNTDFLKE